MFKWIKRIIVFGLVGTMVLVGGGYLIGGRHAFSYLRSSGKMLRTTMKDSIPIEFEIQRARDLLDDLVPEMRANLRLVAAEEVDVANLESEIEEETKSIAAEKESVQKLRQILNQHETSYRIGHFDYSRAEVVEELARRFEHLRTAEMLLDGKEDLLRQRRRSLQAALKKLDGTRLARTQLESQIESLEAQFRLIQAQSTESEFHIDDSKLTQTQEIISELKDRLAVAQKVMAREAKFVELIPVGTVHETSVVERVDNYFSTRESAGETGDGLTALNSD